MKLAVAISPAGSSQVLIKRPRDRGDSVGNKWEWMDGIETFRIRAAASSERRVLARASTLFAKIQPSNENLGCDQFFITFHSFLFVFCHLRTNCAS